MCVMTEKTFGLKSDLCMGFKKKANNVREYRINDELDYAKNAKVRIVGNNVESKVVTFEDAVNIAESLELDLIEIQNNGKEPILRIQSYEKFLYEQKKHNKKQKPTSQLKEIPLSVNIADHDLATKVAQAKRFIADGDKVKLVLSMRGRELSRREYSKESFKKFIEMMSDVAVLEAAPKDEGNKTFAILKKK